MEVELLDKKTALERGLKRYFSKVVCKDNHTPCERYTDSNKCVVCVSIRQKKYRDTNLTLKDRKKDYRLRNLEYIKLKNKEWYDKNKEYVYEYRRNYYSANRDVLLENQKIYYQANRDRLVVYSRAHSRIYYRSHKSKYVSMVAKRRADRIQRTPSWADPKKIEEFYILAKRLSKETGVKHHVDHIIPLKGKLFLGFMLKQTLE